MTTDRMALHSGGKPIMKEFHIIADKAHTASADEKISNAEREKSRKAFNALAKFYMRCSHRHINP